MSGRSIICLLSVVAGALLMSSCSVTRRIPQGSYLLKKNVVEVDKSAPRNERFKESDIQRYIRQSPNKRMLGTNSYVWIYSLANPDNNNWINRMLRRIGEEPVIMDTAAIERSVKNIGIYMKSRGFFNSSESYSIDSSRKRAVVTYKSIQGKPYRIGTIKYDYKDKFIKSVIERDSNSTLIRSGNIFDIGVLDRERLRIADYLKDQGYYNFSVNNISYIADSMAGDHRVNLTMIVKQYLSGYNDNGDAVYENSSIFRLKDIYLFPNYNPTIAATDSSYKSRLDTLEYRGLTIIYDSKLNVRKEILRQTINLYPNHLYSAVDVKKAYNNIMRLGYYKSASILFTEDKDSTLQKNFITFIGSDSDTEMSESTTEKYLICNILCTPALRQSYKLEVEASSSSNFYGLTGTIGYQNRNLMKGMEVFDISFRGGYELMRAKGTRSSVELGGTTSISFPRFIAPFSSRFTQTSNPRTKFEVSLNSQRRPYYHRTLSGASLGYSWSGAKYSSYTLRPIDISLVKMGYIDQTFWENLENPYLKDSYKSQLVAGISTSYVFNNQLRNLNSNALVVRVNMETMGNLLSGVTHLVSKPVKDEDYYNVLGVRYAQYFRIETSVSNKIVIGEKSSIVYRLLGGTGISYGNAKSLPNDRLFYCGGSNGMRGWIARTLGPGSEPPPLESNYPSRLGNLKLEANLETRFPVWGMLYGALFFDVGNIWFLKQGEASPEGVFQFNSFFSQLGFNTGVGTRFDFGFFVLRLDLGVKLHDPNKPMGSRWTNDFRLKNTTLNFGVGYPF